MKDIQNTLLARIFRDLRRGAPQVHIGMPWGLRSSMWLSAFFGGLWTFLLLLAPFNLGTFAIDDQLVSGPYFLSHAGPFLLPGVALLLAIAFGIRTGRTWVRVAMVAFWTVVAVHAATWMWLADSPDWVSLLLVAVIGGSAVWYIYGNGNVRAYYGALERRGSEIPTRSRVN
jgi:hypothetical protein